MVENIEATEKIYKRLVEMNELQLRNFIINSDLKTLSKVLDPQIVFDILNYVEEDV
jgi:hypothetical protein